MYKKIGLLKSHNTMLHNDDRISPVLINKLNFKDELKLEKEIDAQSTV